MIGMTFALLSMLFGAAAALVVWAGFTLGDPPAPREVPRHAAWTAQGPTEPLGPRFDPPPDLVERDQGDAQPLNWPGRPLG